MAEYQLSDHNYVRRELFNLHVQGGLKNPDRIQKVEGWYYDKTLAHSAKIVIDFGIGSQSRDEFVEDPSSLRFDNYQQLKAFIFHLIRGSVLLGKTTGNINPQNYKYLMEQDIETIKEHYAALL